MDLLILPPHCSHILQPLDVSAFSPLKHVLAAATDAISRLDPSRIPRIEWTEMYLRAPMNTLTSANILSGWKTTGLEPLSLITMLDKLPPIPTPYPRPPYTPGISSSLDLSLLSSSPPDGTELRETTELFNSDLKKPGPLMSPAKRFAEQMTRALEIGQSENVTFRLLHKQ